MCTVWMLLLFPGYRTLLCGLCCLMKLIMVPVLFLLRLTFAITACLCSCAFGTLWCPAVGIVAGTMVGAVIAHKITTGQMRKGISLNDMACS